MLYVKETQSLPSKLVDYQRERDREMNKLLDDIEVSDSESLDDAEIQPLTDWALPINLEPILYQQSTQKMCYYFQTKKENQPPIDDMLGMSPLAKVLSTLNAFLDSVVRRNIDTVTINPRSGKILL